MGDHGVVAILSSAVPPAALGVQISNTAANGGVFEFDSTKNEGSGEVTKQDNFYKITGTAVSKSSSGDAGKPFEVDVTCTT
jgi:Mycobacterium 19 kDa lipoprotein antigen